MRKIYTKEEIEAELISDYNQVSEKYGEKNVFGVFFKGSYNYGLQDEYSDIDTVAIIFGQKIPYWEPPKSSRNGDLFFITFAEFEYRLEKSDYLLWDETLFTNYFIVNPLYKTLYQQLVDMRERIVYAQPRRFSLMILFSMQYMVDRIFEYRGTEEGKYQACKQLCHVIRESDMIEAFYNNYPNKTFLELNHLLDRPPEYLQYLKDVKRGKIAWHSEDIGVLAKESLRKGEKYCRLMRDLVGDYMDQKTLDEMKQILKSIRQLHVIGE